MSIRSNFGAVCPTHDYNVLAHHRPAETMRAGGANPINDHGRYGTELSPNTYVNICIGMNSRGPLYYAYQAKLAMLRLRNFELRRVCHRTWELWTTTCLLLWDDHHPADAISDDVRYEVLLLEFYAALLITFLSRI